jgi:hypothetical protein
MCINPEINMTGFLVEVSLSTFSEKSFPFGTEKILFFYIKCSRGFIFKI